MMNEYPMRNNATAYRIINGVAMVVGAQEGKLLTLNDVGTFIWEQADGKQTFSEIIDKLCQHFDVDYSRAMQDAVVFVKELESKGLLVLSDHPLKTGER